MSELKMYRVDDDGEHHHAIAESEQDALVVVIEAGLASDATTPEEYIRDYGSKVTARLGGDRITLTDDDGTTTTRTADEWIAKEGRGLFSSSVF